MRRIHLIALAAMAGVLAADVALAEPAPVLQTGKDEDGRALPFGRAAHQPSDKPLGTGPYKAIMAEDPSLPDHTIYYPANLAAAGKLPVITWGNGACINAGNRFRIFLTEIASHGFVVISGGPIANIKYEVGPQENPAVPPPGAPPAPPTPPPAAPAVAPKPGDAVGRNTAPQMIAALDWAEKANVDKTSKFFGKLDTTKMAAAGQSCGGNLTSTVASDPRVKAAALFSGSPSQAAGADGKERLGKITAPVLVLAGDAAHDVAHERSLQAASGLASPVVFTAWQDNLTHIGTYGMPNGGQMARLGWQWFAWQLKGDQTAAKTFKGADCTLCKETGWHVSKKGIE